MAQGRQGLATNLSGVLALCLAVALTGCATQGVSKASAIAVAPEPLTVPSAPRLPDAAPPDLAAPTPERLAVEPEPASPANVTLLDPLRPEVRLDWSDRSAQEDLWNRVRRGFAIPDLDDDTVRVQERWYATRPDYVLRMTERGSRYLYHIVEEVQKRGMPTELALLPFIESAFNPQAMSRAKASGMWQFIPSTGRNFALKQNVFRDDRRDVLASTRAALDYLEKLYGMFGDWHLALAAYNWGEGSVSRAVARNQKLGLPTEYTSLKMPAETRGYVPKLQAVKNLISNPERFAIELPPLRNHPSFLGVAIDRDIDIDVAARLAGMSADDFKSLNPQMNRPVILAAATSQLLLPYDNANLFVRALPQYKGPLASWTAWVAPKTLKTAEAARLVGMPEARFREVNAIPPRMLVKAGSTLLVPRGGAERDVSEHVADTATLALAPEVQPGRKAAGKHKPGKANATGKPGAAQVKSGSVAQRPQRAQAHVSSARPVHRAASGAR